MAAALVPGRRLRAEPRAPQLLDAVARVAGAFTELDGTTIRVDLLGPASRADGMAFPEQRPPRIAFPRRMVGAPELGGVIAHELTHLLQRPRGPYPNGERACDLFSLARCGTRFPAAPSYLRVPPGTRDHWTHWAPLATVLARRAVAERDGGVRRYIRWWEGEFARSVAAARRDSLFGDASGLTDDFKGGMGPI
ncbi:MAG TPA: hypothetical protein VFF67_00415 [Thermoplasmata archaeon]|nr:hypothetical protein [Thermoplasmata archaeon]